jgi:hypothetical protein
MYLNALRNTAIPAASLPEEADAPDDAAGLDVAEEEAGLIGEPNKSFAVPLAGVERAMAASEVPEAVAVSIRAFMRERKAAIEQPTLTVPRSEVGTRSEVGRVSMRCTSETANPNSEHNLSSKIRPKVSKSTDDEDVDVDVDPGEEAMALVAGVAVAVTTVLSLIGADAEAAALEGPK